jgi:hypothetical protein
LPPAARLGPLWVFGFDSPRAAQVALPARRGYAILSLATTSQLRRSLTLRASRCSGGGTIRLFAAGGAKPPPTPSPPGRGTMSVKILPTKPRYALVAFVRRPGLWQLTASRNQRRLGSITILARGA